MVQVIFESQYELIIFGLFGLAYLINMIYYGESPSTRIDAVTKAIKAIVKEANSTLMMWFGGSDISTPPAPDNPYFEQLEKVKDQHLEFYKKTIEKIEETNNTTRSMMQDHFLQLSDRVERLEYFTLSEQKKEEYSELKSKDNKHTN